MKEKTKNLFKNLSNTIAKEEAKAFILAISSKTKESSSEADIAIFGSEDEVMWLIADSLIMLCEQNNLAHEYVIDYLEDMLKTHLDKDKK